MASGMSITAPRGWEIHHVTSLMLITSSFQIWNDNRIEGKWPAGLWRGSGRKRDKSTYAWNAATFVYSSNKRILLSDLTMRYVSALRSLGRMT